MSTAPILLTGATGQVGFYTRPLLKNLGPVLAPTRAELDLTSESSIRSYIREHRPRCIVNPAAYTAVDKAEEDQATAFAINAVAPRILGEEAAAIGAPVIHFSTDYVFSGQGTDPWRETDAPDPINVYGASKLAGEHALAASGAAHIILRTSWVYSAHGKNFLLTILRLARERSEMKIVDDQIGSPTSARSLARLAAHLVSAPAVASGTYHAADAGYTSWLGFAQEIVRLAQAASPSTSFATLLPTTTAGFPTPAKRPANSRLDTRSLLNTFGFTMPTWHDALAETMLDLMQASPAKTSK